MNFFKLKNEIMLGEFHVSRGHLPVLLKWSLLEPEMSTVQHAVMRLPKNALIFGFQSTLTLY